MYSIIMIKDKLYAHSIPYIKPGLIDLYQSRVFTYVKGLYFYDFVLAQIVSLGKSFVYQCQEEKKMAIIKCPECGRKISDEARECPGCGFPMVKPLSVIRDFLKREFALTESDIEPDVEDTEKTGEQDILTESKEKSKKRGYLLSGMKWKYVICAFVIVILLLIGIQNILCYWRYEVIFPKEEAYRHYLLELNAANDQICRYDNALSEYNDRVEEIDKMNKALNKTIEQAEAVLNSQNTSANGEKMIALIHTIKEARDKQIETPEQRELIKTFDTDGSLKNERKEDIERVIRDLRQYAILGINSEYAIKVMTKELFEVDYSEYINRIESQTQDLEKSSILIE